MKGHGARGAVDYRQGVRTGRVSRWLLGVTLVVVATATACAGTPPQTGLVKKLEQVNGLTLSQAKCVANGLYNGMRSASPTIVPLTASELRAVAKPDNAGKVDPATMQKLQQVVAKCVPVAKLPNTSPAATP